MATNNTTKEAEELKAQLVALQSQVSDLTATMGNLARSGANDLQSAAATQAEQLKAKGSALAHNAEQQMRTIMSETEDHIRKNPATAVAVATGIGFVVGLLMSRR